jgi:hypothetical protein
VVVPELVWAGLLEESLEVVCRRSCLALAAACGSRDAPHTEAACFLNVAAVIVGRGCSPLRMLLAPLLATLVGILDGDVGRRIIVAAWGHLPAAYGWAKFGCLVAGGVLGGDVHSSMVVYLKMSFGI